MESMENKIFKPRIKIPEWEFTLSFARASGPGGQKVNKTSTKAALHFNVDDSRTLTEEQKKVVKEKLGNRLNEKGEIVLSEQSSRSQWQNRRNVIRRLNELIEEALMPEKERRETKVSRREKEKRLEEKKHKGGLKEGRKKILLDF